MYPHGGRAVDNRYMEVFYLSPVSVGVHFDFEHYVVEAIFEVLILPPPAKF